MNMKRTFGAILTILGTVALIWSAVAFLSGSSRIGTLSVGQATALVPFIIGLIFFFSGIGLIKAHQRHSGLTKTETAPRGAVSVLTIAEI